MTTPLINDPGDFYNQWRIANGYTWPGMGSFTEDQSSQLQTFESSAPVSPIDPNNIFADLLEEEPDIPYFGAVQRAKLNPNQLSYFRTQRQNVFNEFQGLLDQQIRAGLAPSQRFADFVGNYPFKQRFHSQAPSQRIGGSYSPRDRVFRR